MTTTATEPTVSVALFPIEEQYRALDAAECSTCGGESVVNGDPCPECGGDDQAPVREALDRLTGEIALHAENLGIRIKELAVEVKVLKAQEDALKVAREARERRIDSIKAWLLLQMDAAGLQNIKTPFATVYTQRNPASFDVLDEEAVPASYKRAVLTMPLALVPDALRQYVSKVEVNKTALADELAETGMIPAGVEYVTDRKHVRAR